MQKIKLYTAAEHSFLIGLLDQLKVPYTSTKGNDGISCNEVIFTPNTEQFAVIYSGMKDFYTNEVIA